MMDRRRIGLQSVLYQRYILHASRISLEMIHRIHGETIMVIMVPCRVVECLTA